MLFSDNLEDQILVELDELTANHDRYHSSKIGYDERTIQEFLRNGTDTCESVVVFGHIGIRVVVFPGQ